MSVEPVTPLASGIERGDDVLRFHRLWQGLGWLMVCAVIWLSLTPTPPQPPLYWLSWDKANHLIAYGTLMYWFAQAFVRHWRWPLFLVALGLALEVLQGLGGVRSLDGFDMLANTLGVFLGYWLATTFLGRAVASVDRLLVLRLG